MSERSSPETETCSQCMGSGYGNHPDSGEVCERCQGNGEIVVDWETYLHPTSLAAEEKSVRECPDCYGYGRTPIPAQDKANDQ